MDKFQQVQQASALALQKAMEEEAVKAQNEADRQSARQEAERQANIAKNLGNA